MRCRSCRLAVAVVDALGSSRPDDRPHADSICSGFDDMNRGAVQVMLSNSSVFHVLDVAKTQSLSILPAQIVRVEGSLEMAKKLVLTHGRLIS
jgi:hypothetical protein